MSKSWKQKTSVKEDYDIFRQIYLMELWNGRDKMPQTLITVFGRLPHMFMEMKLNLISVITKTKIEILSMIMSRFIGREWKSRGPLLNLWLC